MVIEALCNTMSGAHSASKAAQSLSLSASKPRRTFALLSSVDMECAPFCLSELRISFSYPSKRYGETVSLDQYTHSIKFSFLREREGDACHDENTKRRRKNPKRRDQSPPISQRFRQKKWQLQANG